LDPAADRGWLADAAAEVEIRLSDNQALSWSPCFGQAGRPVPPMLDMAPYLKLKQLLESIGDPRHVHFANVAGLEEVIREGSL
jgi:hypothetical protein